MSSADEVGICGSSKHIIAIATINGKSVGFDSDMRTGRYRGILWRSVMGGGAREPTEELS